MPMWTWLGIRSIMIVRVNLRKLEGLGIIKRVGADKNGHWEIVKR